MSVGNGYIPIVLRNLIRIILRKLKYDIIVSAPICRNCSGDGILKPDNSDINICIRYFSDDGVIRYAKKIVNYIVDENIKIDMKRGYSYLVNKIKSIILILI